MTKDITLQFSVRLRRREFLRESSHDDAVADGNGLDPGPGPEAEAEAEAAVNVQTVNMTFDADFSPSPLGPLNLLLRDDGTVAYVYAHPPAPIDADIYPTHADLYILKDTISLFPSCPSRRPCWLSPPPSSLSRLWPLVLWVVTVAVAVFLVVPFTSNAPSTYPPLSSSRPDFPNAFPRIRMRQAPLHLLDDLITFLQHHTVAPLPVVWSVQDIVDRHYRVHPKPPSKMPPGNNTNMTVTSFFNHLYATSSDLCTAVKAWSMRSRSPLHSDVVLLCRDVSRSTLGVAPCWYKAAVALTSSWPSSSTYTVFHLIEALREHVRLHDSADEDANGTTSPDQDVRFYNETSRRVLDTISTLFFTNPKLPKTPSTFAQVVYNAADDLESLQHTVARVVMSVTLLVDMLRSDIILDARAQKLRNDTRDDTAGWLVFGSALSSSLNATELALARIIPPYDHILPLLNTASALTWAIGFSRQLVDTLVTELHVQGNRTIALLSVAAPMDNPNPKSNKHMDMDTSRGWRAGSGPWVTETWEQTGGSRPVLTRTHWYLPAVEPAIKQLQGLANWGTHHARRSRSQWDWWVAEAWRRGARNEQ
ncbi:hypothetical protein LY76DRAFT_649072 [Colletotrichum caudatum]|nr:hypothetical protein LY76DRAFT_649072 [Colletotrichum caudatum]